ncbi:DMT family transporter [Marimonas lutisalis]|uniref:DMT family transporter n=1 Tax=Marimonas lutisalis TaxID=2545756 RepID=UPI0010F7CB3B|nr:DMT family transporter [Marimonas lutisalis]
MTLYLKGFLITLAGVLIISPDSLLIRMVEAETWAVAFWRGVLSGVATLLGYRMLRGRGVWDEMRDGGWPMVAITVVFALGSLCFVYSITHTQVANTLLITSTSPVFSALIAWLVLREAVGLRTWVTIALTLAGIGIIASDSLGAGGGDVLGDLAALGAALSLAVSFSVARATREVSQVPAFGLAAVLSGFAAAGIAPGLAVPGENIVWLALLGLVVVPLGFALLATGPRYIPAPDVSLLLLLEAVFGPLLVWWVLGEDPGARVLLGGALVLGAMVMSNLWLLQETRRARALP